MAVKSVSWRGRKFTDAVQRVGVPVPCNARVAPFLPHGDLLPHFDRMITNGGFGVGCNTR